MIFANLEVYQWVIIGVSIFVVISLLFGVWITFETARRVYMHTLSTKMGESWGRVCSAPNNPAQVKMWDEGIDYMSKYQDKKEDVDIYNDGLHLFGEFFNFGGKKTVVFLCGRCECALYAYYYAKPYLESGLNLLFIDPRAHGLSEGQYSTCGIMESEDALAWMKFLQKEKGQESFVLHCVCVGGAAGLLAITSKNNPGFIERIVVDGLFINFKESYKRHYIDQGHKLFPVYYQIWFWFRFYTHKSIKLSDPHKCVQQIDLPILFIHTKNDKFSLPQYTEQLFNDCASKKKELVWFDNGTHSHIRDNETEKYDATIKEFLTKF